MAAAALPLLYLIGVRGFNESGQLTTVIAVNATTGAVRLSPLFVVKSPFAGCNIAFDPGDAASKREALFYIPDGSPMEPAPEYAFLSVSTRGEVVRRVKAHGGTPPGGSWDWPFVSWDAANQRGLGVGSLRPPPGPEGNTSLVAFDPVTGEQTVVDGSADLQFVGEEPFCVSGADAQLGASGSFFFANGIIDKQTRQQVVTVDVASGRVANAVEVDGALVMSVAGYTGAGAASVAFVGLEPYTGGPDGAAAAAAAASTIVRIDPLAKAWKPETVLTLAAGWSPSQGAMAVAGDTLFVLTQVDGEGRSQLVVGDLSRDPPAFAAPVDVDLSCCPWGVGALGATPL